MQNEVLTFIIAGIRREVRGILLVHVHEMPHVLLLKTGGQGGEVGVNL